MIIIMMMIKGKPLGNEATHFTAPAGRQAERRRAKRKYLALATPFILYSYAVKFLSQYGRKHLLKL